MTTYSSRRTVAFSDTDAAGVLHFSRALVFVEDAEHQWLRESGMSVGGAMLWPRVKVAIEYTAPCLPNEELTVVLHSPVLGKSSFTYSFEIHKVDGSASSGIITLVRLDLEKKLFAFSDEERARFAV